MNTIVRSKMELIQLSTPDTMPVWDLTSHRDNARDNETKSGAALDTAKSFVEEGQLEAILCTSAGTVQVGNVRLAAGRMVKEWLDKGIVEREACKFDPSAMKVLILPDDMTTEESLSLLADHSERPLTLPELAREFALLKRMGLSTSAAAKRIMPQASVLFSGGTSADVEKGFNGRFQTLQGLAVPEVIAAIERGEIVNVANLRVAGALHNKRTAAKAGCPAKGEKRTAEELTTAIEQSLQKKEKAERTAPTKAQIVERIAELIEKGDEYGVSLLKWAIGAK